MSVITLSPASVLCRAMNLCLILAVMSICANTASAIQQISDEAKQALKNVPSDRNKSILIAKEFQKPYWAVSTPIYEVVYGRKATRTSYPGVRNKYGADAKTGPDKFWAFSDSWVYGDWVETKDINRRKAISVHIGINYRSGPLSAVEKHFTPVTRKEEDRFTIKKIKLYGARAVHGTKADGKCQFVRWQQGDHVIYVSMADPKVVPNVYELAAKVHAAATKSAFYEFPNSLLSENIPTSLEQIQEFRDFRGLDDRRQKPEVWNRWITLQLNKLTKTVKNYPGVHGRIVIPGETDADRSAGIVVGFLRGGKFASLLAMDDLPPEHRKDNPYAAVTEKAEKKFLFEILKAPADSLLPADVMRIALDACDGNYPLAVLTVHAVFKVAAKKGRSDGLQKMFARRTSNEWKKAYELRLKLRPHSEIAKRLRNLRPAGDTTGDKMGPWYHGFGILSAGAISSPVGADWGQWGEHTLKWIAAFGPAEGAYNKEKNFTDKAFAKVTYAMSGYNRFIKMASPEQIQKLQRDSILNSSIK